MRNKKRYLAAGMALAIMVGLSACAGEDTAGGGAPGASATPAEVLSQVQTNLIQAQSMSYQMLMDYDMSAQGQAVKMSMDLSADFIRDPMAMKLEMAMDMGEQGSMETTMYVVEEDGESVSYTSMEDQWIKQELAALDVLKQYDIQQMLDAYLENSEGFEEKGSESVNGLDAIRYDGVISTDYIGEVLKSSGALDQMTSLGLSEEDAEAMYSDLGTLPVSIWVDSAAMLPVKYEMDMTGVMQKLMDNMMEQMAQGQDLSGVELKMNKVFTTVILTNINGVTSVEVPAEVKDAALAG